MIPICARCGRAVLDAAAHYCPPPQTREPVRSAAPRFTWRITVYNVES